MFYIHFILIFILLSSSFVHILHNQMRPSTPFRGPSKILVYILID